MTEETFERAIENFFTWPWQTELIVKGSLIVVMLVVALILFKAKKKTGGWICLGVGGVVFVTDIVRLLFQAFAL